MTDDDGILGVADLILATKQFASVLSGIAPSGPDPTTTDLPYCWVRPVKWAVEKWEGDDPPESRSRIVHFEIEVTTQSGADPKPAALATAIERAVHGQQVAQTTSLVCETGLYHKFGGTKNPQHRLTVTGHFTYEL